MTIPANLVRPVRAASVSLGAVAALLVVPAELPAASLSFSPINLHVRAPARAGSVRIANRGAQPVQLQLRLFKWDSPNRNASLVPTRAAIVSPPSALLPAGQSLTIRIASLEPPAGTEQSFRLIIDEIRESVATEAAASEVKLNLRTSIPVFFAPAQAAPDLSWTLSRDQEGLKLTSTNTGNRHLKLVGLGIDGPDGRIEFNAAGAEAYVLPGSTMTYRPAKPVARTYPPGTSFTLTTNPAVPFAVNQPITLTGD